LNNDIGGAISIVIGLTIFGLLLMIVILLPLAAIAAVPLAIVVGVRAQTLKLYNEVAQVTLPSEQEVKKRLYGELPDHLPDDVALTFLDHGYNIVRSELEVVSVPPPPLICNTIEGARYRDMLSKVGAQTSAVVNEVIGAVADSLYQITATLPTEMTGRLRAPLRSRLPKLNLAVSNAINPFFRLEGHFKTFRETIEANYAPVNIMPDKYQGDDVVEMYLKNTPLLELFRVEVPFGIPEALRTEHHHIVAGSGHGKTQTLQYMISEDLERDCSIVVVDSQGDLINNIKKVATIPEEKLVIIDPTDIEFPLALNLFDIGMDRIRGYSALEREKALNSVIELYDYILNSLLGAELTSKQGTAFRFVTRLLLHVPDATILNLREIFEPKGLEPYRKYLHLLSETGRSFFENEFEGREFTATKSQVLRRLYTVLENQTFENMFTSPKSRLNLFDEMDEGKVILVHTAEDVLGRNGCQVFGRFFIALVVQALQERASQDIKRRTYLYLDEADQYFDQNIDTILVRARKRELGLILSHQYLDQLSPKLASSVAANTAIKFAGGVSAKDARAMASQMGVDPKTMTDLPKGVFATWFRGEGASEVRIPFGVLEALPQRTDEELTALRERMREKYAVLPEPEEELELNTAKHSAAPSNDEEKTDDGW
jgi:hypothetical protein